MRTIVIILALSIALNSLAEARPPKTLKELLLEPSSGNSEDIYDDDDIDNRLIFDGPVISKRSDTPGARNNVIYVTDLEREASERQEVAKVAPVSVELGPKSTQTPADQRAKANAGAIAFNSREVRLVGPDQKEVEMKDDTATKMIVALENLQKEASDVWGQVNKKLDKGWTDIKSSEVWGQVNRKLDQGWTDLKAMVEDVLSPKTQKP